MKPSGLKIHPRRFKDFSHERTFGAGEPCPVVSLGRLEQIKKLNLPIIYQGEQNTCVSCCTTWLRQYFEATGSQLSWEYLARISHTGADGAEINQVLDPAGKTGIATEEGFKALSNEFELRLNASPHKIGKYFFLENLDRQSIYNALKANPVLIGVVGWNGMDGGHCMALVDVDENGDWICANWWGQNAQLFSVVSKDQPIAVVVTFPVFGVAIPPVVQVRPFGVVVSKFKHLLTKIMGRKTKVVLASLAGLFIALTGWLSFIPHKSQQFGSSGIAAKYRTTLSSSISNTASSVAVSSLTLKTTEVIGGAGTQALYFPLYLTVNPGGTTDEDIECWGVTTSTLTYTGCVRGLSNIASNTTSTVTGANYAHAAGETVIMSNSPFFFNRFVDTFTAQNVTGTKTFINAKIVIGNNVTTTGAGYVYFANGQTNNPYFKIVGPTVGNSTSSFYFSVDGTSDLQLNASGTTFGASTTRAIFLTNGLLGLNASTTQGLNFDSSGNVTITASSTSSTNGGFLTFNTVSGNLFWDVVSFLKGVWTWTGSQTFAGTKTTFNNLTLFSGTSTFLTNATIPLTPTSTTDAASKGYVDGAVNQSIATGTAGMTITAGKALYVSTTGTLFLADSSASATAWGFVGFSAQSATVGQSMNYIKYGGIVNGLSGLATGGFEYLSTAGGLSTSPGTVPVRVGLATSSTTLQVTPPAFHARVIGTATGWNVASVAVTLGFIPTRVKGTCFGTSADSYSTGRWVEDRTGAVQQDSVGLNDVASPLRGNYSKTIICQWTENPNVFTGTLTTSTNGFVLTTNNLGSARTFQYEAEYDSDGNLGY